MPDPPAPAAPGPTPDDADRTAALRALGEQLPRLVRLVHALRAAQGRDRAALVLLLPLERLGPLRQGALADLVHADPSTVSRHVAALIDQDLVRRVTDEDDGRASRLAVTPDGRAALERLRAEREAHLAQVTADWPDADIGSFTTLFGRLLDDLAACLPTEPGPPPATAPGEPPARRGTT